VGQRLGRTLERSLCDTLIVLSGAPTQGGVIGQSTYWRSVYAVLAYRKCGMRKIVLTGGNVDPNGPPVADSMAEFVESQGVPPERVVRETRSNSTWENALYTQPLLWNSASPPVLLTSDFHMFRARRAFEKLGIAVQPRPIPDALKRATTWRGRWPAFLDVASETVKIVYYYARGWI
jgi:uncharacterized SAM-binding protein YcdF (DUF218 family)